jgi:hypothetical protein
MQRPPLSAKSIARRAAKSYKKGAKNPLAFLLPKAKGNSIIQTGEENEKGMIFCLN